MGERKGTRVRANATVADGAEQHAAGRTARSVPRIALPPYETVALVLQGGGALGAYQAGVYEGLHEAGIVPNWIAGISIGALNTAIIAGNAPEHRVARLKEFWNTVCQPAYGFSLPPALEQVFFDSPAPVRTAFTTMQAFSALVDGQRGFFVPRVPPPLPFTPSTPATASWYDTAPLKATLERLCDFDRINSGETRVSVAAVNVGTGNFEYFDNRHKVLRAEHFIASGSLPPGFAATEIDGEYYWDGGLMSNTPLSEVIQTTPRRDTLAFQVDLWSARGPVPTNLTDVQGRLKDIQYSSRTRMVTDTLQHSQRFRHVLREVLARVAPEHRDDPWCKLAEELASSRRYNVFQLVYRDKEFDGNYKDYQFGESTMNVHWECGLRDIRESLAQPGWLDMPDNDAGFVTHDIHRDRR
ncbi:patatin-like phospholipase family protein [Trinickia diaoshuihuensis]|uniref:patatin-like phospholipase family protein n=1 Tax=Trinickia diaoshuihuensis TaxID=2292265 RepID=UPI000E23A257|nr:patatin-like phospholipase family protein [Trinickia diaoshuihuensis]